MARIRLENVTKVYKGGVRAVSDASLEIKDKEFIVFVGPSGCGKSTTLRMIAGLEDITSGNIFIGDKYVNDLEPKDRNIAMVFQNYALYPHMSVYENMAYSLRCQRKKKEYIDEKVKKAAEILGITEYLNRTPKELSGGQRQRVALGRAIVREPAAFLFDEPLSNLDAKLRVQMRAEINKLHQDIKTTFVYVTHDQTEAMTMGDRIVVMKDGLIQQVDTPMNLYEHPGNVFVATFLGSPQMNIFSGKIAIEDGKKVFQSDDGGLKVVIPDVELCQIEDDKYPLEAFLGVRPNDVLIGEEGFEAKVELVERLGEQTLVYFHLPGREGYVIAGAGAGCRLLEGDMIKVSFNKDHLHLFDKQTTKSLSNATPLITLPLGSVELTEEQKVTLKSRVVIDRPATSVSFYSTDVALEKAEGSLELRVAIEGSKDYGDERVYYGREAKTEKVIPFRCGAALDKKATVYVPLSKLNYLSEDGERITDDEPSEGPVYEATLDFRPRGCFLSESTLHNDEKAYKTVKATRLGSKTVIHLVGAQNGQKLTYIVPTSDLIYASLMVYMRKKAKQKA